MQNNYWWLLPIFHKVLHTKLLFLFSEINPIPPYMFFTWNPSYGKTLWQSKLEKESVIRFWLHQFLFWNTCTFRLSFRINSQNNLSLIGDLVSKSEPNTKLNTYCVNQFLGEKRHKKWNLECKQKHSRLFKFCNIFDLLTSGTEKITWWPPVFKLDFYIISHNEQLRKM